MALGDLPNTNWLEAPKPPSVAAPTIASGLQPDLDQFRPTQPAVTPGINPSSPTASGGRAATLGGKVVNALGAGPAIEQAKSIGGAAKTFLGSIPQNQVNAISKWAGPIAAFGTGAYNAIENKDADPAQHWANALRTTVGALGSGVGGALGGLAGGALIPGVGALPGAVAGSMAGGVMAQKAFGLSDDPFAQKMQTEYVRPSGSNGPVDASPEAYAAWEAQRKAALPQPQLPVQQDQAPATIGAESVSPQAQIARPAQPGSEFAYTPGAFGQSRIDTNPGAQLTDAQRQELSNARVAEYNRQAAESRMSVMDTLAREGRLDAGMRESYKAMGDRLSDRDKLSSQAAIAKMNIESANKQADLNRLSHEKVAALGSDTQKYIAGIQSSDKKAEMDRRAGSAQERLADAKAKMEMERLAFQQRIEREPAGPVRDSLSRQYQERYFKTQPSRAVALGATTNAQMMPDTGIQLPDGTIALLSDLVKPQTPEQKFGYTLGPRK